MKDTNKSICLLLILWTVNAQQATYIPFGTNYSTMNVINNTSTLSYVSTSTNQSTTAVNTNYKTTAAMQARIDQLEHENNKLKGTEACKQMTWLIASLECKIAKITNNVNVCKADNDIIKGSGSIQSLSSSGVTIFNAKTLREDYNKLSTTLDNCFTDLNTEKATFTANMTTAKNINIYDFYNVLTENDKINRDLDRYNTFQGTLILQLATITNAMVDQQNKIRTLNSQMLQINSAVDTAKSLINKCTFNTQTFTSCVSSLLNLKTNIETYNARLNAANYANSSLNDAVKILTSKLNDLSLKGVSLLRT